MKASPQQPKEYLWTFDVPLLMSKVETRRQREGLRWFDIATDLGMAANTLSKLAAGKYASPGIQVVVNLMAWVGETDLAPYRICHGLAEETEVTSE